MAAAAFALGTPAIAATTITSSAYGISADLGLVGFLGASLTAQAPIGGTAPPSYNLSSSVLSVAQTLGLGVQGVTTINEAISTGLLTSTASSALPGTPTGQGSSTVNNLSTGLSTKISIAPAIAILNLGSSTITSTTTISGVGPLLATGTSQIQGLTVSGLALGILNIDGSAFVNPAPNTVLLNLLGLKITLNEQIASGDGITTLGLTTNAIHIAFNDFLVGGALLTGNVIVGHSAASITLDPVVGVPEPAVWLQLIVGFGFTGALLRSRRRARVMVRAS